MKAILILGLILILGCSADTETFEEIEEEESIVIQEATQEEIHTKPIEKENGKGIFTEKGLLQEGQERVNEPKIYPKLENGNATLTEEQWHDRLTGHEFRILFRGWTETRYSGDLLDNTKKGIYVTAGCGLPVFSSETKYDSETGWPSFWDVLNESNIILQEDNLLGFKRTEILSTCGEHLGHLFDDGPEPTGQRYCINSAALDFIEEIDNP